MNLHCSERHIIDAYVQRYLLLECFCHCRMFPLSLKISDALVKSFCLFFCSSQGSPWIRSNNSILLKNIWTATISCKVQEKIFGFQMVSNLSQVARLLFSNFSHWSFRHDALRLHSSYFFVCLVKFISVSFFQRVMRQWVARTFATKQIKWKWKVRTKTNKWKLVH